METKVSFFIVAGYLVPGMIFGFVLSPLVIDLLSGYNSPALSSFIAVTLEKEAVAVVVITLFGFCSLACAFTVGVFLSDIYFKLLEAVRLLQRKSDVEAFKESSRESLANLLGKDWLIQEAYVLALTQGPDVYGYAARNRMLGASGFGALIAGIIYLFARAYLASGILVLLGIAFIMVGASLARRYRTWISAYAALFYSTGCLVKAQPRSGNDDAG